MEHIDDARASLVLANGRSAYIATTMLMQRCRQSGAELITGNKTEPVDLETGEVRVNGRDTRLIADEIKNAAGVPGTVTGTVTPEWDIFMDSANDGINPFRYTENNFTVGFDNSELTVKPAAEWQLTTGRTS
jgi:hypothetical protein